MVNELLEYEYKAPAVLWYWEAWSGGTKTFSRFLKGCYMDLLDAQFNSESHSLTIEEIKTVLGSDFGQSWPTLQKKFKETSPGQFMNKRLTYEKLKYSAFSKSRKQNAKGEKHKPELVVITIEDRKLNFKEAVRGVQGGYSDQMLSEFVDYWAEDNGKKMRWEMEKVFNIPRRLATWAKNSKKFDQPNVSKSKSELADDALSEAKQELKNFIKSNTHASS